MAYQLENNLAEFLRREIAKEVKSYKSMSIPLDYTVDRIFALIEIGASKAVPMKKRTPAKPDYS